MQISSFYPPYQYPFLLTLIPLQWFQLKVYVVNEEFEPITFGTVIIALHQYTTLGNVSFHQVPVNVVSTVCDLIRQWNKKMKKIIPPLTFEYQETGMNCIRGATVKSGWMEKVMRLYM